MSKQLSMLNFFLLHMFVYLKKNSTLCFLRLLALLLITLVQSLKSLSNMNLSNFLNVNDHIKLNTPTPKTKSCINYSAMEPVLYEKLHDIKLSCSVFRVTTFFQFDLTNVALSILLQYAHNLNENMETLYSTLVLNNI